jgi:hypothetical protein
MKIRHILPVLFLVGVFGVAVAGGQELAQVDERHSHQAQAGEIPNWTAPATWSPARPNEGLTTMGAVTSPLPFIGITPCRLVDTRPSQGFTGAYGPPILVANATRDFDLNSAPQCPSVPASAQAYSLNITVTETAGPGDIRIWPTGTAPLNVSTQNWAAANVTIANAAIVPAGTNGSVTVQIAGSNTHLIIDINGYYAPAGVGTRNTFLGLNAGNFTMTGDFNTSVGFLALGTNTTGNGNTAVGWRTLQSNDAGIQNTAFGGGAMATNHGGAFNTAVGFDALNQNNTGSNNVAVGQSALSSNTASSNTALGFEALVSNTSGSDNVAVGRSALSSNTASSNVAIGRDALFSNTSGSGNVAVGFSALLNDNASGNIAIGYNAGTNTSGDNNIFIGSAGVGGDIGTIRIGTFPNIAATYIAGIRNAPVTNGDTVMAGDFGRLGTTSSARRFKDDIRDIAEESDGLMKLRPVAFEYKSDPTGTTQYGLIAEEVAEVYPHLVGYDQDGQLSTVHYHLINALLLNEVQKQHRTVEALEETIEQQKETIDHEQAEIEGLKARLSRLEARLPAESRP